jgi:outer membrane protein OmpA-like peptidoglycan-associated protein
VAAGQSERDRILLNAKTREAEAAHATTEIALDQRDIAAQQAANLQSEVDALKATQTSRGIVLTLGDVLFDTGKSELKPGASRKLDQLAQFLNDHPDRRVEIDGFTDSVGTDAYNEELSQNRADSVRAALLARGIDGTRITTQGFGKEYPVASNTDSGGRQLNRRVEVVIGSNGGTAIAPRTSANQASSGSLSQ